MPGFFDLSDPNNRALLGLASGLLQAGAPSRLLVPFGVALGNGLQGALAGMQGAYRPRAPGGLVPGSIYRSGNGLVRWTGSRFEPVVPQPPAPGRG